MKLVVAITGASGAIMGIRMLELLRAKNVESHLIITRWGLETIKAETSYPIEEVKRLASFYYDEMDLSSRIASGSYKTAGMAVVPCSMKTLAGIANGYAEDLVTRAADVTIKEGRKLVLVVRETPLSPIHLENMLKLSRIGVQIMPPVPAFYARPNSLDDIIFQTIGRVCDQFNIEIENLKRWGMNCSN